MYPSDELKADFHHTVGIFLPRPASSRRALPTAILQARSTGCALRSSPRLPWAWRYRGAGSRRRRPPAVYRTHSRGRGTELARADFGVAFALINHHGPTTRIASHASGEAKARPIPAMQRGDATGCTVMSEPCAGSDFGAILSTATRVGGGCAASAMPLAPTYLWPSHRLTVVATAFAASSSRQRARASWLDRPHESELLVMTNTSNIWLRMWSLRQAPSRRICCNCAA